MMARIAFSFMVLFGVTAAIAQTPAELAALAPAGKLRVGVYPGSPIQMVKGKGGENRGLTVDLGADLARLLGLEVELVSYTRVAEVLEGVKVGDIDFTITNATASRAMDVDFMPNLLSLKVGYLVPPGSSLASADAVDQPGIRVGVVKGSTSETNLPRGSQERQRGDSTFNQGRAKVLLCEGA